MARANAQKLTLTWTFCTGVNLGSCVKGFVKRVETRGSAPFTAGVLSLFTSLILTKVSTGFNPLMNKIQTLHPPFMYVFVYCDLSRLKSI